MYTLVILVLCAIMILVNSIRIPFIENTILVPVYASSSTIVDNQTCDQCLCTAAFVYPALNCFPNNTCQFFFTVPRTYRIQATPQARLYFPQQTLPNASVCCMPDLDVLLSKLRNATPIYVNIPSPRCLALDNQGYLATVQLKPPHLYRFDATNLTLISNTSFLYNTSTVWTMSYYNGTYYIGLESNGTVIIDSSNLTVINTFMSSHIASPRDVMVLNNENTMVVTSNAINKLVFFNRTSSAPLNYSFSYEIMVSYLYPHGLLPVNDTFFYVTSWGNHSIYSYTANSSNGTSWTETLLVSAGPVASSAGGAHLTIDECDRRWFSLYGGGVMIYDNQWNLIGNFSLTNSSFFDTLITDNYVIYFSDGQSKRIIRIDPTIDCWR